MGAKQRELPEAVNVCSEKIIGAAIEVHRELGPGLLERVYEAALLIELHKIGLQVESQVAFIPIYKGTKLPSQRLDLVVENTVLVELKAVEKVADVHIAQLVSYLRLTSLPLGLLLNFNVAVMKSGITRKINSKALSNKPTTPNQLSASSAISAPLRSPNS